MTMINSSYAQSAKADQRESVDELARKRRLRAVGKPEEPSAAVLLKSRIKKLHVPDTNWALAKDAFDGVVARAEDPDQEGVCVVVNGPSGAGKTHFLRRFMSRPELQPTADEHGPLRPLLYVLTPSGCTARELGERVFYRATGHELSGNLSVSQVWEAASAQLRGQGTSILVCDEFHHVFGQNDKAKRVQILSRLKELLFPEEQKSPLTPKKFPIQIVLGGLPIVKKIVLGDDQLSSRNDIVDIEPVTANDDGTAEMLAFLKAIEPKLEFPNPCDLGTYDMALRFMKAAHGYTGRAMRILKRAAFKAIERGQSSITLEDLGAVLRSTHNLRREKNPFFVADVSKCPVLPLKDMTEKTLLRGKKIEEHYDDEE